MGTDRAFEYFGIARRGRSTLQSSFF